MSTKPMDIKTCPSCGSKAIAKVRRDWRGEVKGQTYVVPKLEYFECPDCGEKVYPPDAMRRIEAQSPTYQNARKLRA